MPYFLSNAEHRGHDDAGAVGQRDEADLHFLLLGLVRALGPDGRAQGGIEPDRADGGGLQHAAAIQLRFQHIGHGASSGNEKTKGTKTKRRPDRAGAARNEPLRDGDAFVRFGGSHPPLDATCLKTLSGLCSPGEQAACQRIEGAACYRIDSRSTRRRAPEASKARAGGRTVDRCAMHQFRCDPPVKQVRRAGTRPSRAPIRRPPPACGSGSWPSGAASCAPLLR